MDIKLLKVVDNDSNNFRLKFLQRAKKACTHAITLSKLTPASSTSHKVYAKLHVLLQ